MQTAGGASQLELHIESKVYTSADGARVNVLRDLHLQLKTGDVGVLIGPSGCGKTTILNIAAGLDRQFVGTRRIPGHGRLGIVFQEPRLLPWRSVADNIRLVLPPGKTLDDLGDMVETLGLGAHLARYPSELSLGLARRVAIARALAVKPDLLLLDEPFVSLDAAMSARLRDELMALTARGNVTTLLVTHDLDDAVQLADRLYFLSKSPATIVADIDLPAPRGERSAQAIAAIISDLHARIPDHFAAQASRASIASRTSSDDDRTPSL